MTTEKQNQITAATEGCSTAEAKSALRLPRLVADFRSKLFFLRVNPNK